MLSQTQIESQLAARRLEIEELKRQFKEAVNTLTAVSKSIKTLEDNLNALPISFGGGMSNNDTYQTGDIVYHKLRHVFNKAIGFFAAAPVAKQTLTGYVTNVQGTNYTGIANTAPGLVYAQVGDVNILRAAYDNLRGAYDDLRTKLQTTTLVG